MGMSELPTAIVVVIVVLIMAGIVLRSLFSRSAGASINPDRLTKQKNETARDIDWNALNDASVQQYLPDRKLEAIKAYRELTGAGLKESKDAVEYALAHPDVPEKRPAKHVVIFDRDVSGHLSRGDFEGAVKLYMTVAGVDYFTARNAVEEMQRKMDAASIPPDTSGVPEEAVIALLREGKKIEAVKLVRQATSLGLKEALDVVNEIEQKLKLS